MKRIFVLIFLIIIILSSYILIIYVPKDYNIKYDLDGYNITESYSYERELYTISVTHSGKKYPIIYEGKYSKTRKLVKKISYDSVEDDHCLTFEIADKQYPVCYRNSELVDFRLVSKELLANFENLVKEYPINTSKTYNGTNIYNHYNKKMFIWNYKGYDYISSDIVKTVTLLEADDYNNFLSYRFNEYLITPSHGEYYFTKLLVINTSNLELFEIDLGKEISYSSYYLGEFKNDIYLLDKKNKEEYKININKKNIKTVGTEKKGGTIYTGEWENISMKKLVNEVYSFRKNVNYKYTILDKKIYIELENHQMLLSDKEVKEIVQIKGKEVYYISGNVLYIYSPENGEIKLLENKEWNFNIQNKIFIFD